MNWQTEMTADMKKQIMEFVRSLETACSEMKWHTPAHFIQGHTLWLVRCVSFSSGYKDEYVMSYDFYEDVQLVNNEPVSTLGFSEKTWSLTSVADSVYFPEPFIEEIKKWRERKTNRARKVVRKRS